MTQLLNIAVASYRRKLTYIPLLFLDQPPGESSTLAQGGKTVTTTTSWLGGKFSGQCEVEVNVSG